MIITLTFSDKNGEVPLRTFELEAYKVGICLSDADMALILKYYMNPSKHEQVMFEPLIRALVPVIKKDGDM
jgi:hypothetical protein